MFNWETLHSTEQFVPPSHISHPSDVQTHLSLSVLGKKISYVAGFPQTAQFLLFKTGEEKNEREKTPHVRVITHQPRPELE